MNKLQLRHRRLASDLLNLLHTPQVHLVLLQLLGVRLELGEGANLRLLLLAHDEGEAHEDVGGREVLAAQTLAAIRRAREKGLQVAEVFGEVGVEVERVYPAGDAAGDGLQEEGDLRPVLQSWWWTLVSCISSLRVSAGRTIKQQRVDEQRHEAALGIVHEVSIPQPALRLTADLAFRTILVLLGNEMRRKVLNQVLEDQRRLGEHDGLRAAGSIDSNDRRLAQRVDLLQLFGSHHVLTFVDFDGVVHAGAFFQ